MTDTVTNEPLPSLDPSALLAGDLTAAKLDAFKAAVFHTVDSLEQLRDWLGNPKAKGTARGVALWALGRHEEAVPLLSAEKNNPAVALCLASSLAALGQIDEAGKLLTRRETDPAQALVWLRALDAAGDGARLVKDFARVQALLNWPTEFTEDLQVLHYGQGAEYQPHHDYFDATEGPWTPPMKRGGNRCGTLVIYLNTPARGGGTDFPDVPMEVKAHKGAAVYFGYPVADTSSRTAHGGSPVIEGEKWAAVKWFRQGPIRFAPLERS